MHSIVMPADKYIKKRTLTIVSIKSKIAVAEYIGIVLVPVDITHRAKHSILADCNPAAVGKTPKKLTQKIIIRNINSRKFSIY